MRQGEPAMLTFCPHCGTVHAGRCPARNRSSEPWRAAYRDPAWERARQDVIERQHGRCASCGCTCAEWTGDRWSTRGLGGEVHHIVPLREGGSNAPGNLALLCTRCHRAADAARRSGR